MYYTRDTRINLRKRRKKERKEKISLGFSIAILILILIFLLFAPIAYLANFTNTKRALTFFVVFQLLTVFSFCWGIFIKIVSSILLHLLDSWKAIFFLCKKFVKNFTTVCDFQFYHKNGSLSSKKFIKIMRI